MEEQKTLYGGGSVRIGSEGARLEVVCAGMQYAFDLILWSDGEIGARCVTRNRFQYATDQGGPDDVSADKVNDIFNELLMIHEKTVLFLDDTMLKGRIAIFITSIRDDGDNKSVEYGYKWSPYLPISMLKGSVS